MFALYLRLIGARIRGQMQYKVSFWLDLIGFMMTTSLEFAVVVILLSRFPSIDGWNIYEIGLLYEMAHGAEEVGNRFRSLALELDGD